MIVTKEHVIRAAKVRPNTSNLESVFISLDKYGKLVGLDKPHRVVHYLSQMMHESASFKYDRELFNKDGSPNAQQERYERDFSRPFNSSDSRNKLAFQLGNTEKGDGMKYAGRTGMQLTGRGNYRRFTKWVREKIDASAPDFEAYPDKVNENPWEGLAPLYYWTVGNPTGKSLNAYADQNNAEMITRRINGGLNGYADRLEYYDRLGLVVLGYNPTDILRFQTDTHEYNGTKDGDSGPQTRAAIHARLVFLTDEAKRPATVQSAPVVAEKPVAVPVKELEKPWWKSPEVAGPAVGAAPALITAAGGFDRWFLIAALIVGALMTVFLIVRRDRMTKNQNATVQAIETQQMTTAGSV